MGESRMGGIRNDLDEGVGKQDGTIITKSGERGGVVGTPTAPANVQIMNKARHTWPIGSPQNPSREIFTLGRGIEWYITLPRNFEKYYPL